MYVCYRKASLTRDLVSLACYGSVFGAEAGLLAECTLRVVSDLKGTGKEKAIKLYIIAFNAGLFALSLDCNYNLLWPKLL
ncbi:MAG: hypothetical protein K1060chlam1_00270 [Candidatus Anoxychlamydiales bacterium]|nr:hypothetical protein [Candidatus Anoxychlamydiales bacterium]